MSPEITIKTKEGEKTVHISSNALNEAVVPVSMAGIDLLTGKKTVSPKEEKELMELAKAFLKASKTD